MSHQPGQVIFGPGIQAYFEYDGTSDIALSRIYLTTDEMNENWRKQVWTTCTATDHVRTPCWLFSSYGNGFFWYGEVCMKCMCITKGFDPNDDGHGNWIDDYDGHPIWGPYLDWGLNPNEGD